MIPISSMDFQYHHIGHMEAKNLSRSLYNNLSIKDYNHFGYSNNSIEHFPFLFSLKLSMETWLKLSKFPFICFAEPININNKEIIIVSSTTKNGNGIYKYIINKDKWQNIIKYPSDLKNTGPTSAFNKNSNILYIFNTEQNLLQIELNNNNWNIIQPNPFNIGYDSRSIFINNTYHIIINIIYGMKK